jgi:hypothetical protein
MLNVYTKLKIIKIDKKLCLKFIQKYIKKHFIQSF